MTKRILAIICAPLCVLLCGCTTTSPFQAGLDAAQELNTRAEKHLTAHVTQDQLRAVQIGQCLEWGAQPGTEYYSQCTAIGPHAAEVENQRNAALGAEERKQAQFLLFFILQQQAAILQQQAAAPPPSFSSAPTPSAAFVYSPPPLAPLPPLWPPPVTCRSFRAGNVINTQCN